MGRLNAPHFLKGTKMKLREAIARINIEKPNSASDSEKVAWITTLDGLIKANIIDTHEGGEDISFAGYDTTTDAELLVPAPFDDIYIYYLSMQIDRSLGEEAKYRNSATLFNNAYKEYFKYYNRNHMPISKGKRFIF
jgi:hypothetical protein